MLRIERILDRVNLCWQGRSLELVDASPDLMRMIRNPEVAGILKGLVMNMGEIHSPPSMPSGYLERVLISAGLLISVGNTPDPSSALSALLVEKRARGK